MWTRKLFLFLFIIWWLWSILGWLDVCNYHPEVKVVFCDVGQGDATLVVDGNYQMLIDGGPNAAVLRCLMSEMPPGDNQIEVMLLTHADSDHFAGLTYVLSSYQVGKLIVNNAPKASLDYYQFYHAVCEEIDNSGLLVDEVVFAQNWCETKNLCLRVVTDFHDALPRKIFSYNMNFQELSDLIKKYLQNSYNYNDGSIGIIVEFVGKKFMFTGDAENASELAMVESGLLEKVDVLKIPHHGSKTSSTPKFLSILQPETSVISCGQANSYGHPHKIVLDRLNDIESTIYRTDKHGKVKTIYRDGKWQWIVERAKD